MCSRYRPMSPEYRSEVALELRHAKQELQGRRTITCRLAIDPLRVFRRAPAGPSRGIVSNVGIGTVARCCT